MWIAGALILCHAPVLGQESIFDPENPNVGDGGAEGETTATPSETGIESESVAGRSWLRGAYLNRVFADTAHEDEREDVFLLQNRLSLAVRIALSPDWTAVVEGRLEHRLSGNRDFEGRDWAFEPTLRDANVAGRIGHLFLTVGNQSIVWGAGTLTQPADVINPLDLREGIFDAPAEQRIPVFAVELALLFERLSLSAVLVPFFVAHRIAVPDSGLPGVESLLTATPTPEASLENMSAGARVHSRYGGVDVGLGYFFGWDQIPFVTLAPESAALFSSRFRRRHTVEADMVTYFDRWGVRLETAYSFERTLYLEGFRADRLPVLNSALALSWEHSASFTVQVEGFWLHVFEVPEGDAVLLTAEDYHGAALLLLAEPVDDLSLRLWGLATFATSELLIAPSLTWTLSDRVALSTGVMIYGGPEPAERITLGGLYDTSDQAYLSVELSL